MFKLVQGTGSLITVFTGLSSPRGVAVASNGDVYISELVGEQAADGLVVNVGGGVLAGVATGLSNPYGVAVASNGDVYIADTGHQRVVKLVGGTGSLIEIATGLISAFGVAVGSTGDVYITENGHDRVVKLVGGVGSPVVVATGLSDLVGVAVASNGDVYITRANGLWKLTVPTPSPLSLALGGVFGEPGDTVSVPIMLTNPGTTPVGGLEFQVIRGAASVHVDSLMPAVAGFTANTNTVGDTTFVVFQSSTGTVMAPGTTVLGTLRVHLDSDIALCTPISFTVQALVIGDSLGAALPDSSVDGEIQAGIRGDLNLDRQISILDVIKLVRVIVGKDTEPDSTTCQFFIADFNGDDDLDVTDVTGQVNIILHITKQISAPAPTTAMIRFGDAQPSSSGGLVIPVELQSDGLIAGLQATVRFDPSAVSVGTPILAGASSGLSLDASVHEGVLRFVVFGTQPGQGITAGSGAVLLIPITLRSGATDPPSFELSDVVVASVQAQRIPVTIGTPVKAAALPTAFSLGANRPNPFNPATQIAYAVPQQAHITLTVYNVLGQEVVRLVNAMQQAGRYTITWDGRNAQGQAVSSGVYLYRLASSTGFVESRRMVLLK